MMGGASVREGAPAKNGRTIDLAPIRRLLPPARLVWLSLVVLASYSLVYLKGLGVGSLVVAPVVAVLVDLLFQRVRFEHLRLPDAALASGLFVALVLPPNAPLEFVGLGAFVAVAVRHVFRYSGRPWFNPAATGILLAAFAFGLSPAWWAGVGPFGEALVIVLGAALVLRSPAQWRIPVSFLLAYAFLATIQHVLLGATTDPHVLLLQATDPTMIFFALFMVAEPRTAPSSPSAQPLYAAVVGTIAAFAPLFAPAVGVLFALLIGNVVAIVLRRSDRLRAARPTKTRRPSSAALRWSLARRAGAGVLVGIVLLGAVSAVPAQHGAPLLVASLPTTGGAGATGCTSDNTSISSSTLGQLHKLLGPSVILSFNSAQGSVVFYDPVNHVTVTETDLYEDYGFAEFNGDDFAVSGCSG